MAPMNHSDEIARLTYLMVRQHQGPRGMLAPLMGTFTEKIPRGQIAKACGTTEAEVKMWEKGEAMPAIPGQGLRWLTFCYENADHLIHGPVDLNGARSVPQYAEGNGQIHD